MVALVGAFSQGVVNGQQAARLGAGQLDAGIGKSGELAYVNVTNGNLVLQRQDEVLRALGTDVNVLRTYNSHNDQSTSYREFFHVNYDLL